MNDPIVRTKLPRPYVGPGTIHPGRLIARAVAAPPGGTIAIVAPAGCGKSTLLAQVAEELEARSARSGWISLDTEDNDPVRFLAYLAAALDEVEAGLGEAVRTELFSGSLDPVRPALAAAINALAARNAASAICSTTST